MRLKSPSSINDDNSVPSNLKTGKPNRLSEITAEGFEEPEGFRIIISTQVVNAISFLCTRFLTERRSLHGLLKKLAGSSSLFFPKHCQVFDMAKVSHLCVTILFMSTFSLKRFICEIVRDSHLYVATGNCLLPKL